MIVFDLRCGKGHVFEAWFGASADYEAQRARGLVSCPLCGDERVEKAPMAPRIGAGAVINQVPSAHADESADAVGIKQKLGALAALQAKMLERSEWVGDRFAAEARAIHHGKREQGAIHGSASARDAAALSDEGIGFAPLPLPFVPPEQSN